MPTIDLDQIELSDDQQKAMQLMCQPRRKVGGYAGTGKTVVIAMAATAMNEQRQGSVVVAAPTNKACSVLKSKMPPNIPVRTIHSLTTTPKPYVEKDDEGNIVDEGLGFQPKEDPVKEHLIIDEASMFGNGFLNKIEHLLTSYCLVGDPMQLQPVKDTTLMRRQDLDIELKDVMRQDPGAYALAYATQLRTSGSLKTPDAMKVLPSVDGGVLQDMAKDGHICITYTNRDRHWFNKRCRMQRGAKQWYPMEGDKVICRETDAETGIFNGMTGKVTELLHDEDDRCMIEVLWDGWDEPREYQVDRRRFEGRFVPYGDMFGTHIEYAYAMTCHSAQGSSWGRVYICPSRSALKKNLGEAGMKSWLYTAVTRVEGSGDVTIIDT